VKYLKYFENRAYGSNYVSILDEDIEKYLPKKMGIYTFSDGSVCNLDMMELFKPSTLTELYNLNIDVLESWIPSEWIESFNRFMFGSTCYLIEKVDGTKEFCFYACDFRMWYNQNKNQIERDSKIETIISK
jgi:hypothetical protein